jgi:hypothetical protein
MGMLTAGYNRAIDIIGRLMGWRSGGDPGPSYQDIFRASKPPTLREQIDEYRNIAYSCANLNARAVASTPFKLYATAGRRAPKCAHRGVDRKTAKWLKHQGALSTKLARGEGEVVEILNHPMLDLLDQVNKELDGYVLGELTDLYQETAGTAYWWIETAELPDVPDLADPFTVPTGGDDLHGTVPDRVPIAIWLIPTQFLSPIRTDQGITGYRFAGGGDPIPADELIIFKFPNLRDPYGPFGWSPLRAVIEQIRWPTRIWRGRTR